MKSDDGGDGREAHLEARAGKCFGAEQEDDQRARRDEPDADCLAAQRNAAEDQQ